MDRKAICAFLVGCEPDQFMAYKDYADQGVAAVGPDGKKYIYTVVDLEAGDLELNPPKPPAKSTRGQAVPKPRAKRKTTTKKKAK